MRASAPSRRTTPAGETHEPIVAEPPVSYRVWPPLVADCSMLAAMLFQEAQRSDAEQRIAEREINAPTLLDYELASVALKKARHGASHVAVEGLARYAAMSIRLHSVEIDAVLGLAGRYDLSACDAAYLWLAADLKAPLATFDRKLGEAAKRHLSLLE
jgi:predicted nucleic acid-binding protein